MITPSFGLTATERVLPKLALDFTTASLDSRVTFTRSGNTATVINSSGLVATVLADVPRFNFNPLTLECEGLLIEESRNNTFLYSEDFSQAGFWVIAGILAFGSGSVVDDEISPDGNQTADLIVQNTSAGTHSIASNLTTNFVSGTTYTQSYFVKAAGTTKIQLDWRSNFFPANRGVVFDLVAKTATPQANATGSITEFANGWFRITATCTATSTGTAATDTFLFLLNAAGSASFTGDGISGVYLWGAQLEETNSPTSYIPTVASTVTRNADVATMTGTNFSDWYSAGAGGVVVRVLPSTVSGTRPALQFDDATADEIIALRGNTTNPELVIVDGGSPQAQIDAGTIAANTAYNLGAAWNTDNCAAAVNGGAAVTDTSATIPTVTQARLGSDGTNYLNGNIQTLRYWPQRIINAEVQAFSK